MTTLSREVSRSQSKLGFTRGSDHSERQVEKVDFMGGAGFVGAPPDGWSMGGSACSTRAATDEYELVST